MAKLLEWSADEASGDALDYSGNGRTLTISSGNFSGRVAGHTNSGLQQLSTGITTAAITGLNTSARTTMFWLRVNASWTGWITEFYNVANDTGAWGLLYLSGTLQWRAKNPSNSAFPVTITPDTGVWHHIAATYDGSKMWVYRDGVLLNAGGTTISGGIMSGDAFRVFESVGTAATIDDVRYFDTALSATEVSTQMATPAGPSTADSGTLAGSFSSPTAAISANGSVPAVLSGAFSSPSASLAGASSASGQLGGSFSTPQVGLTGEGFPPAAGTVVGQFSAPISSLTGVSTASGSMSGSFSAPVFAGQGGLPQVDRDILFTITVGTRSAFELSIGAQRTSISEAPQRTTIGVGNMDDKWRNGSEQYIDFTVTMLDPEAELSLAEVQAVPFQVAVTNSVATPARDDAAWVDPSVAPEVTEVDGKFVVLIKHMYEATATGLHAVWVKFGPTPESPIYQVTTFVVL